MRELAVELREAIRSTLAESVDSPETAIVITSGLVGVLALVVVTGRVRRWWRGWRQRRQSAVSHDRAKSREPPVEIGDVVTAGIQEFSHHHSGERHAVCKVEGFVLFVEGVPADVDVADVISVTILSFNRGRTSATARYRERA